MKKKEPAIIFTGITSLLILGEFIKKKARPYRELFYKEQEFYREEKISWVDVQGLYG